MGLRDDIKLLKEKKGLLEDQASAERSSYEADRRKTVSLKESNRLYAESLKIQEKINLAEADRVSLGKQINKLSDIQGTGLDKVLGITKSINLAKEAQKSGDKEAIRQSKLSLDLKKRILSGEADEETILREKSKLSGKYLADIEAVADSLKKMPNFAEKASLEKQAQDKINDFRNKTKEVSALLSSPLAMGVAVVGLLVQQMVDFAQKTLEVRQNLGTSVVESARLAGNMKAAGLAAKSVGGSSEQAEAAISAMVDEFGTTGSISSDLAISLGRVTGQFGISGVNAAKLLKSMQGINGASAETNLSLISAVGELARAEGVAPGAVLNDIAENTETFAQFAKGGGENLAQAAIEARKLGLNLGTVASIAENLLDFESSIEKEMEASMLLGRQMNLDKARELALSGDLAGLAEEVKNQVGSQAEFEAMNVVQRKALAAAMGVTVSDLSKMVAGEKTSAQLAEDRVKTEKDLARMQMISAAAIVIAAGARMGGLPGALIGAGIAAGAVFGLPSQVTGLEKGGVVKKSGIAEVHKGEVFSGTRNEMGMGNGQTNKLLRELIEQNEILMNKLTNRVGDIALSNAV